MTDKVNHPSHYTQGGVECIDAITAATVNKTGIEAVCTANVIKYLWRYEAKNGLEDVKKAQWYINRLIAELEGKPGTKACPHEFVPNPGELARGMCRLCGVIEPLPIGPEECNHVWSSTEHDDQRMFCIICRVWKDGPL